MNATILEESAVFFFKAVQEISIDPKRLIVSYQHSIVARKV
jgi:hypothetical protein